MALTNGSFKDGATGWTLGSGQFYDNTYGFDDRNSIGFSGFTGQSRLLHDTFVQVYPGQSITATCMVQQGANSNGAVGAGVGIVWYDSSDVEIDQSEGNFVSSGSGGRWNQSTVTATAPAGASKAKFCVLFFRNSGSAKLNVDVCDWNYVFNRTIELLVPDDGATYTTEDNIPFRVTVSGTTPPIDYVEYLDDGVAFASSDDAPYSVNYDALAVGTHPIVARATLQGGQTISSSTHTITVTDVPPVPITREFKASNSYSYLINENFAGLSSAIPSTALIVGAELEVNYALRALIRAKDFDVPASSATSNVLFDLTDDGTIEAMLLNKVTTDSYSQSGTTMTNTIPLTRSDFTVTEDGLSEGKRWTVMDSVDFSATIGGEADLFGATNLALADFLNMAIGFRFTPNLATKPAYADSGDACIRFLIDRLRLRVYFDAGSVEYYFASPDKSMIIKGILVSATVDDGNFRTGDASGVLQLQPTLEIMDGSQTWIGGDWTIHSAYPPTDANQIGDVDERPEGDGIGMSYNGLPSYAAVTENRSRYEFITANFYGDKDLNSIYGAHGLPRAFAYNRQFFYKIHTQPDAVKDSPRHVAYHHAHLALGYLDGNVDISVVGKPYNFDGSQGASSWTIGDRITGLLPLSGTILGIFGAKSVWGLSGTTVDNFATQVISAKKGAIEYTISDMGFPVYANSYGVYTLSQTQQYGDYLGTPMSQDISPWLRPRLIRKVTSDKEVVCAWPVRSKNQYRLAFSDGYVMSMTINGAQAVPTFSFQKYFSEAPEAQYEFIPLSEYEGEVFFDGGLEPNVSTLNDGIVTLEGPSSAGGSWQLFVNERVAFRITPISYSTSYNPFQEYASLSWYSGPGGAEYHEQPNQAALAAEGPDPIEEWTPSPIVATDTDGIIYSFNLSGGSLNEESYQFQVEIGIPTAGDIYSAKSIVPSAVSSELDETGEEKIHIADSVALQYVPDEAPATNILIDVWSKLPGGEFVGVWYNRVEPFNEELVIPSEMRILGAYSPKPSSGQVLEYPPPQDPLVFDTTGYTYTAFDTPIDMQFLDLEGTPYFFDEESTATFPEGNGLYIVRISLDGNEYNATADVRIGF